MVDAEQQLKQAQEKDPGLAFTDEFLQQRHEETVNIQQQMAQLGEMMNDLTTIVYEQGQELDTIENEVEDARRNVEKGKKELEITDRHQRNKKNKYYIFFVVVVVIAIIAVLAAVLTTYNN